MNPKNVMNMKILFVFCYKDDIIPIQMHVKIMVTKKKQYYKVVIITTYMINIWKQKIMKL